MARNNEMIQFGDIENQIDQNLLTFPDDAVFEPNVLEGQREGKVEVFKEGLCIAVLHYKNNKLNGLCKFYENAKLQNQVSYVNGKKEGWSKEGDNQYLYRENKIEFELVTHGKLEGYVNEINIKTGKINRCYKMNEDHKPVGVGYIYEDGELCKMVTFKEENEEIVIKEFKEGKMFERDENGDVIYEGEYLKNECMWFPRHGNGKESKNGEIYIGNWIKNHKEGEGRFVVKGHLRYEGMWKNDVPNGKGCLFDDDDNVICEREWNEGICEKDGKKFHYRDSVNKIIGFFIKKGKWKSEEMESPLLYRDMQLSKKKMVIFSSIFLVILLLLVLLIYNLMVTLRISLTNDLLNLLSNQSEKEKVKVLIINKNSCNDMEDDLEISGFTNLEKIVVKKNSLKNLNSLKICNNEKLKTIEIEDGDEDWNRNIYGAFLNVKNVIIESI